MSCVLMRGLVGVLPTRWHSALSSCERRCSWSAARLTSSLCAATSAEMGGDVRSAPGSHTRTRAHVVSTSKGRGTGEKGMSMDLEGDSGLHTEHPHHAVLRPLYSSTQTTTTMHCAEAKEHKPSSTRRDSGANTFRDMRSSELKCQPQRGEERRGEERREEKRREAGLARYSEAERENARGGVPTFWTVWVLALGGTGSG